MSNSHDPDAITTTHRVTFDISVTEKELSKVSVTCGQKRKRHPSSRALIRSAQERQAYLKRQQHKKGISGYKYVFLKRVCRRYKAFKIGFEQWRRVMHSVLWWFHLIHLVIWYGFVYTREIFWTTANTFLITSWYEIKLNKDHLCTNWDINVQDIHVHTSKIGETRIYYVQMIYAHIQVLDTQQSSLRKRCKSYCCFINVINIHVMTTLPQKSKGLKLGIISSNKMCMRWSALLINASVQTEWSCVFAGWCQYAWMLPQTEWEREHSVDFESGGCMVMNSTAPPFKTDPHVDTCSLTLERDGFVLTLLHRRRQVLPFLGARHHGRRVVDCGDQIGSEGSRSFCRSGLIT